LARLMKSPVIDEMTPHVLWQTESGAGLGELGGLGEPGDVVEANATTQTPTSASIAYGEARMMADGSASRREMVMVRARRDP